MRLDWTSWIIQHHRPILRAIILIKSTKFHIMYPQGLRCEQHLQAIILLWQKFKNIVIAVYIIGLNSSSFSVVIPFVIVFGIPPIKAEYISTSFDFGPGNKDNFVHYKEAEMMQEWVLRNFECFHLPSCTSTITMKRASLSGPLVQGRWQKHAKQPTQMSPDKMSWFPTDPQMCKQYTRSLFQATELEDDLKEQ